VLERLPTMKQSELSSICPPTGNPPLTELPVNPTADAVSRRFHTL